MRYPGYTSNFRFLVWANKYCEFIVTRQRLVNYSKMLIFSTTKCVKTKNDGFISWDFPFQLLLNTVNIRVRPTLLLRWWVKACGTETPSGSRPNSRHEYILIHLGNLLAYPFISIIPDRIIKRLSDIFFLCGFAETARAQKKFNSPLSFVPGSREIMQADSPKNRVKRKSQFSIKLI